MDKCLEIGTNMYKLEAIVLYFTSRTLPSTPASHAVVHTPWLVVIFCVTVHSVQVPVCIGSLQQRS